MLNLQLDDLSLLGQSVSSTNLPEPVDVQEEQQEDSGWSHEEVRDSKPKTCRGKLLSCDVWEELQKVYGLKSHENSYRRETLQL